MKDSDKSCDPIMSQYYFITTFSDNICVIFKLKPVKYLFRKSFVLLLRKTGFEISNLSKFKPLFEVQESLCFQFIGFVWEFEHWFY